jgi:hypothetical protein
MTLSLDTPLDKLLSRLKDWMPIPDFEKAMVEYFSGPRSKDEIADYRAKRGKVKKLRDEVTPVWNHISFVGIKGEVRFELNDSVPDCWMRRNSNSKPWGVEVTIAQSREQHHLGQELNEKGIGRGFIGLPDDAPSSAFASNLARGRVMYSTESALTTTLNGVTLCLKKKKKAKYAGFDLLIEAPLYYLPQERWNYIQDELQIAAADMPFREIHIIGGRSPEPIGFRIK